MYINSFPRNWQIIISNSVAWWWSWFLHIVSSLYFEGTNWTQSDVRHTPLPGWTCLVRNRSMKCVYRPQRWPPCCFQWAYPFSGAALSNTLQIDISPCVEALASKYSFVMLNVLDTRKLPDLSKGRVVHFQALVPHRRHPALEMTFKMTLAIIGHHQACAYTNVSAHKQHENMIQPVCT